MLSLNHSDYLLETGTDEAGRGCLAGPVSAAAVILPKDFANALLNDSKQLSEKNRLHLKPIIESQAVAFAVTHLEPGIIDEINKDFTGRPIDEIEAALTRIEAH